ncbi:MAG: hypothetical protein JWO55_188 [Candidatus Saccharibacteria bacterium]|jgi:hypothetical protein|nr:hypothetical protein [Candidatus Saccharibacteria bacterium]
MQTNTTFFSGLTDEDHQKRALALRIRQPENDRTLDDVIGNIKLAYRAGRAGYATEQGLVGDISDSASTVFKTTLEELFEFQSIIVGVKGRPHRIIYIEIVF